MENFSEKAETLRFVKLWLFEGAPSPAVSSIAELRPVLNKNHKAFGKYSIYSETPYSPISEYELGERYFEKEKAIEILTKEGFIPVKSDFDQYSIDDLKEIKSQIDPEWVKWFNAQNY